MAVKKKSEISSSSSSSKQNLAVNNALSMPSIADFWKSLRKRFSSDGLQSGHSIGYWGGVCLLANNITGPGMVLIPSVFAQSGWLFPTILFVLTGSLSAISVLYLAKSLTLIPGNENLQKRMEFAPLIKMLFPKWLYRVTFFGLLFLLQIIYYIYLHIYVAAAIIEADFVVQGASCSAPIRFRCTRQGNA